MVGFFQSPGNCQVPAIDEVLYCINGRKPLPTFRVTSVVATSFPAFITLHAHISPRSDWGRRNFTLNYGVLVFVVGNTFWVLWVFHLNLGRWIPCLFFWYVLSINLGGQWGRTAFHIFTIPDNNAYDLWRLEMVAHHQTLEEPPTSRIFIFPESSPCIAEIVEAGGCVDPVLTETCLKSVPVSFRRPDPAENLKVALHMSFKTKTTITLGHRVWPLQHTFIIFYFLAIQSIPESHIDLIQLYHIT